MPKVYQYIPAFYDARERPTPIEYKTKEDLLEIDFIRRWSKYSTFFKFSYDGKHLMAELDNGYTWYVIAIVEGVETLGFPAWDKGRTKVTDGFTRFTVQGKDVAGYCGDVVTMRDGRILRKAEA